MSDDIECPTCGDTGFKSVSGMKAHHTLKHNESIAGIQMQCDWCGEEYRSYPSLVNGFENNFCDENCYGRWQSENRTGENAPQWNGGNVAIRCDWCGSEKSKPKAHVRKGEHDFCSQKCTGKWMSENLSGSDHPHWRGGYSITDAVRKCLGNGAWAKYSSELRESADTCYMCGDSSDDVQIDIHHIVPIMHGGTNDRYNLMPLCSSCHMKVEWYTQTFSSPVLVE